MLILVVLIFFVMFLILVGIFVVIEGWLYGDVVYYMIIIMIIIGFGDFVIGKLDFNIFFCVFMCVGVFFISIVLVV